MNEQEALWEGVARRSVLVLVLMTSGVAILLSVLTAREQQALRLETQAAMAEAGRLLVRIDRTIEVLEAVAKAEEGRRRERLRTRADEAEAALAGPGPPPSGDPEE